jgi:sirohydrochlorin cobaltochelatase
LLKTALKLSSAYLLVSHGSRDRRPHAEVEVLRELIAEKILACDSSPLVGTACLELAPLPLHRQIQEFGEVALSAGKNCLQIVPLFLLPGVHVMEDIPAEVAIAQTTFGSNLTLDIRPHLGSYPGLGRLLATEITSSNREAKILLSHGSRRSLGNEPVEKLAQSLGAVAAYWSVSPSLEVQACALADAGYQQICVIPYFLFSGGITDAIAGNLKILSERLPNVDLRLTNPFGASAELANLILDLVEE